MTAVIGIEAKHPSLTRFLPMWRKIDDAVNGPDCIKEARELYLPRLNWRKVVGWKKKYDDYLDRAMFPDIPSRTRNGIVGLIMKRQLTTDGVPASQQGLIDDVTRTGKSLTQFGRDVASQIVAPSRVGISCDVAADGTPYQTWYAGRNIHMWHSRRRPEDGRLELMRVCVCEKELEVDPDDNYGIALREVTRYREIYLKYGAPYMGKPAKSGRGVHLVHRVWYQNKEGEWLPQIQLTGPSEQRTDPEGNFVLLRRDHALDFLPFYFGNPTSMSTTPETPMLLGIVNVSLGMYRNSADLENFGHWSGRPQLYWFGYKRAQTARARSSEAPLEPGDIEIGTGVWTSENADAKAGYAQIDGGIQALERLYDKKKELAVELGARLVESRPVELTATQSRLRDEAEHSAVSVAGDTLADLLTASTAVQIWWAQSADISLEEVRKNVAVKVNMDRGSVLSPAEARAWAEVNVVNPDLVTLSEAWDYFNRHGVYAEGATFEDHMKDVALDKTRRAAEQPGATDDVEEDEDPDTKDIEVENE